MAIHLLYYGFAGIWGIDGSAVPKLKTFVFCFRSRVQLSCSLVSENSGTVEVRHSVVVCVLKALQD